MDKKSTKSHNDEHNQLQSDEVTRNKIDKHLSDIDDTISEEDIKNINIVVAGTENVADEPGENTDKKRRANDSDEDPKKEAPTPWEILGD